MEENNKEEVTETVEEEVTEQEPKKEEAKTYTEEDVKELLKNYVSKDHVNEIIQKEKAKAKKKSDEAERLANLTKEQLLEEINKINIEKESLIKEREELEALKEESLRVSKENALNKLKLETKKALTAANLSEEYFDLVFNEAYTAEDINNKIQKLAKLVNDEKKKEKETIIKGAVKVPKKANSGNSVLSDKERFKKMSLIEKQELKNKDPELYRRLSSK